MTTNDSSALPEVSGIDDEDTTTPLVDAGDLDEVRRGHGSVTVSCRFRCASDGTFGGRWRGVRVRDLLGSAPPETTHIRAWSADGYRATVPLADALDAVIATERVDESPNGVPRFVGEKLDSAETVRDIVRIDAVALPHGVDPEPLTAEESPE